MKHAKKSQRLSKINESSMLNMVGHSLITEFVPLDPRRSDHKHFERPTTFKFFADKSAKIESNGMKVFILWPNEYGVSSVLIGNKKLDYTNFRKSFSIGVLGDLSDVMIVYSLWDIMPNQPIEGGLSISQEVYRRSALKIDWFKKYCLDELKEFVTTQI